MCEKAKVRIMSQTTLETPLRILVIGGGVIGSVYAAWLQQAGHQVTMLARGQRLVEVREQGLEIEDVGTGRRISVPVATVDHLAPNDTADIAIVAVRLEQVGHVFPMLAANTAIPTVLFLLNDAYGAEHFADAIGRARAVLGFPGIGGRRVGSLIKYYVLPQQPTTLGEIGGQFTPRLRMLAGILGDSGQRVVITTRMDAWLKTHAIFVTCLAAALDGTGGDSVRLAHDRRQVALMVQAIQEGFRALQAQGIPVVPQNLAILFGRMPRWFATGYWQHTLQGPVGTLAIAPHARAARAEMVTLADQVMQLLRSSPLPTPTLHRLLATLTAPKEG